VLSLPQCFAEGVGPFTVGDELDEVRYPPLLGGKLHSLELDLVGEMGVKSSDPELDPLQDVAHGLGVAQALFDAREQASLGQAALSTVSFVVARRPTSAVG
jgi:hypothetical protein